MRPQKNKKGARCQPLKQVIGNPMWKAVLRPSQALLANNKQDITRTDNIYTQIKQPLARIPKFTVRYKELFTLYDYVRRLRRTIQSQM